MSQRQNEIEGAIKSLEPLLGEIQPSEGREAVVVLVGGALLDLARIADAVVKLSEFELTKIGDLLHVGGPDFTDEERETIEALRRGDIKVVQVIRDPNTDPRLDGPIAWLEINKLDGIGMPPIDPETRVEIWGQKNDGPHEGGWWRGQAKDANWIDYRNTHWRPALVWHDWDGSTKEGPEIPAGVVVDIKFRRPSAGDPLAERLAVNPREHNWKNEGRPTNADIVGWRYSAANWINFYIDYQATLTNMKAQAEEAKAKG